MAEARDYSEVAWPWSDDPNWDAPREGATSAPSDGDNWQLRCRECGLGFPEDFKVAQIEAHYQGQHPGKPYELNLVWVGLGVPPKGNGAG